MKEEINELSNNLQSSLGVLMQSFAETVADMVMARIKEEEEKKPHYYTRKELCELLHVTAPTVIEMVKRGEIQEKKIGGRVLYDAAAVDAAVKEQKVFRYKRRVHRIW